MPPNVNDWFDDPNPILRGPEDIEKLHEDLRPYVFDTVDFGLQLKHPLHFQIIGIVWKMANAIYAQKLDLLAEARAKRDWHRVIFLHERPWRLDMLYTIWKAGDITLDELRDVLPTVWTDAEYPSQHKRKPLALFRAAGFVTDDEEAAKSLPEVIPIWRGTGTGEKPGIAWTTSEAMGGWFARRFRETSTEHRLARLHGMGLPLLLAGTVARKDVLGYFVGRGEAEIVVNPVKVRGAHPVDLPPLKDHPTGVHVPGMDKVVSNLTIEAKSAARAAP